jgi:hypothetical protein
MKIRPALALGVGLLLGVSTASAQFKKLLQKAEQKAENAVDKKAGVNQNQNPGNASGGANGTNSNGNTASNPSNKTGGGLVSTPPDVKQNLADAETAYKSKSYGEARYAVQQAMLGVELEIGNKILKSLPTTISGLSKLDQEDQVASSGFGWAGLTIQRKYNDGKDKQFKVTIANNSAWMSAINLYLSNGGYAQQTGGQQNWKQTKVKGYRAIIEFNQGSGYKLSVPIGQSSLIVFEAINFATEQETMSAASTVDIDGIKKQLGEQ